MDDEEGIVLRFEFEGTERGLWKGRCDEDDERIHSRLFLESVS